MKSDSALFFLPFAMKNILSMLLGTLTKTLGNWASVLIYGGTIPIQEWVINQVLQSELSDDNQISQPRLQILDGRMEFSCYVKLSVAEISVSIPLQVERLEIRGKRASLELKIMDEPKISGVGFVNQCAAWIASKTHQPLINGLQNDLFQIFWPNIHVDLMHIPQIRSLLSTTLVGMSVGDIMHVNGVTLKEELVVVHLLPAGILEGKRRS